MNAIILCAGLGTRLLPITLNTPKPLLQIKGKSILENTINILHNANISDIVVVCGYKHHLFTPLSKRLRFKKVVFPHFASKNSAASLKCAISHIKKGTLIINGDLFFTRDFTQELNFGVSSFLGQEIANGAFWGYITDENCKLLDIDINANSGFGDGVAFLDNEADLAILKDCLMQVDDSSYWENLVLKALDRVNFYAFKAHSQFYTEIDSIKDALDSTLLTPQEVAMQISTDGNIERLKGITNINYKITYEGKSQVLRLPRKNIDNVIDREAEQNILKLIAPLKITCDSVFYGSDIKISAFLDDFVNAEFSDINDDFLFLCVEKMRILHNIKFDSTLKIPKIYLLDEIKKYENLAKITLTTQKEHKYLLDIARFHDNGEFVLCHRDLQLPNIMIDKHINAIKFIDFEYAGFSCVAWELGNFAAELALDKNQIKFLSQTYANISELEILQGMLLSNYIWCLWGFIYGRIDLARDYLARFNENLKELCE